MNLNQLKTKANTRLSSLWDALVIREEAYRLKRDNYFQVLVTSPVVDGEDTTMVVTHPNDEIYQSDIQFGSASPVPFQLEVQTWGTRPSRGFRLVAVVELLDGRKFTRSRSYTDTRERVRDLISGDNPDNYIYGDWYLTGSDPVIETTAWTEVIDPQ